MLMFGRGLSMWTRRAKKKQCWNVNWIIIIRWLIKWPFNKAKWLCHVRSSGGYCIFSVIWSYDKLYYYHLKITCQSKVTYIRFNQYVQHQLHWCWLVYLELFHSSSQYTLTYTKFGYRRRTFVDYLLVYAQIFEMLNCYKRLKPLCLRAIAT